MAENKEKQYVSDNAQLMAEWHPTKNGTQFQKCNMEINK